jgi:hypothetical protein
LVGKSCARAGKTPAKNTIANRLAITPRARFMIPAPGFFYESLLMTSAANYGREFNE